MKKSLFFVLVASTISLLSCTGTDATQAHPTNDTIPSTVIEDIELVIPADTLPVDTTKRVLPKQ
ncbi:MAG: hypothetical protein RL662_2315 [Bacteroidota bacterium]